MAFDVLTPVKVVQLAPHLLASVAQIFGYGPSLSEDSSVSPTNIDVSQFALRGLGGSGEGSGASIKSAKAAKTKLHELVDRGRYFSPEDSQVQQRRGSAGVSHSAQGLMEPLRIGDEEQPKSNPHRTVGRAPTSPSSGKSHGHRAEPSHHSGHGGHGGSLVSGGGSHGGGHSGGHGGGKAGSEEGKALEQILRNAKLTDSSASGNAPEEPLKPGGNNNKPGHEASPVRDGDTSRQGNRGTAPANQGEPSVQGGPSNIGGIAGPQGSPQNSSGNISGTSGGPEGWTPGQPVPVPPLDYLEYFRSLTPVVQPIADDSQNANALPIEDDANKNGVPQAPNSGPPPLDLGDLGKDSANSSQRKKISLPDLSGDESSSTSNDSGPDLIEVTITEKIRAAAQLLEFDLDKEYAKLHLALHDLRFKHDRKTIPHQGVLQKLIDAKEKELGHELNADEFEALVNGNQRELEIAGNQVAAFDEALETVKAYCNARYAIGKKKAKAIAGDRGEDKYAGISIKELEQRLSDLNTMQRHLEAEAADAYQDIEKISFDDRPYDLVADELEKAKKESLALRKYIIEKKEEEKRQAEKSGKTKQKSKAAQKIEKEALEERAIVEREHNKLLRFFDELLPVGQKSFRKSEVKVLYNSTSGAFMPARKDGVYCEEKKVPLISLLSELSDDQLDRLYDYMMQIEKPSRLAVITYVPNYTDMLGHVFPDLPRGKGVKKELSKEEKEEAARDRAVRKAEHYKKINGGQKPEQTAYGPSSPKASPANPGGKLSPERMSSFLKLDQQMADQIADGNTSLSKRTSPAKSKSPKRPLSRKEKDPEDLMGH